MDASPVRGLVAALVLGGSLVAQNHKLHPPLTGGRDVTRYETSPDGRRVVYLADADVDDLFNLFSVDLKGGEPKRLESRSCSQFVISPDSRRVAYTRFPSALCSVPIDGSGPPIDIGPYTGTFDVTADGSRVVFLVGGRNGRLFSVPIDGSEAPVQLHESDNIHFLFELTPDGSRVVFLNEGTISHTASMGHVYSARVDGSEPPVLLNTDQSACSIGSFAIDPSSTWLVYREGRLDAFTDGVFGVPLDGSAAPALLNAPLGPGGARMLFTTSSHPRFTPDGERVVFRLDPQIGPEQLLSAPSRGGQPAFALNAPLPPIGVVGGNQLTLDGSRVVYVKSVGGFDTFELFAVPVLGGAPVQLNAPIASGGRVFDFELSPDGRHVAYRAAQAVGELGLYLTALDGAEEPIRIIDSGVSGILGFAEASTLVFEGFDQFDQGVQLFAVDLLERRPWRLDGPMVTGGGIPSSDPYPDFSGESYFARIALQGKLVVYRADQDRDEVFELYASPLSRERVAKR